MACGASSGSIVALLAAPRAAARDEAPVLQLHDVEDTLLHPLGLEVLRVDAEALGQRVALRREPLADLVRARERVLGRDVVAVRRQAAQVGRARLNQLVPPIREVRRDLDAHVGHEPPALGDEPLHVVSVISEAHSGIGAAPRPERPSIPRWGVRRTFCDATGASRRRRRSRRPLGRSSADAARSSGGSPPGCGRGARARRPAPRAMRCAPPRVSPMPTRIPEVNGIRNSPAASIVAIRTAGCFDGEPAWTVSIRRSEIDSSISPCEAVTSRRRARSAGLSAPRFVWAEGPDRGRARRPRRRRRRNPRGRRSAGARRPRRSPRAARP